MGTRELLKWQWEGYPRYHRARTNLLIHIVAVPMFLIGTIWLVASVVTTAIVPAVLAIALSGASIGIQGVGHGKEEVPPEPFTGPANAAARIMLEQWITFPRFVLTGGWRSAWSLADGLPDR